METALIIAIGIIKYRRVTLEKLTVPNLVNKSTGILINPRLLTRAQEPATCSYTQPHL
jgi:hypothetical protein